jgi:acyl-coenzyme A synthetase/AMP-(fatty) acid ligase
VYIHTHLSSSLSGSKQHEGISASEPLAEELKAHVKATIAPYQYPRWIEFQDTLPKTATGKIQRYKLRG